MTENSDQSRVVLAALQKDAATPLAQLAETLGMAPSTLWRKVQDLDAGGVIRARVALLDAKKVGAGLCAFAQVSLTDHSEDNVQAFARIVRNHPQIQEAYAMAGQADYMLKIRCADVEAYEAFLSHTLLRATCIGNVVSSFALKELKYTTELPL